MLLILDGVVLTLVRDAPGDASPGTWEWLLAVVEEVAAATPTATASAGGSRQPAVRALLVAA